MAKNQGNIKFGVQFQVDKTGLNELKNSLQQLQNLTVKDLIDTSNTDRANDKLNKIKETAQKITQALEDSYNVKLDTTNLSKFQKSLSDSGLSLSSIKKDFAEAGVQGQIAFRNLATELATTNKYIKQSSQWLDKMAETLSNTVRWSIASSAVNAVTGSIQKAYSYTKQLDSSLNDIVIVTGKSSEEMDKFARKANDAAKALGATTTDYTKASLIYYQQGLSDSEVAARAEVTTKVANVTGTSADAASEQLTAIWNGYKVSAEEAEKYIDKVSAVAASTAADLEELSVGMSRVASAANIMGVDIDQLNAQLATIVSVTREAPESIGTALKTVYARMSDIQAGLDEETTLDEYTEQMAQMGINVLDAQNNLRDMGDVVEEIGSKWNELNRNQQVSLAQTIAGTRQYSRMMSLFDNWNMYEQAKEVSETSLGSLEQQNDRYLDSMEAHLNQLSAAAEGLYDTLFDPESLNKLIDGLTKVVELADQVIQGLGGGGNFLMTLGSIGINLFGDQITRGLSSAIRNTSGLVSNMKNANIQAEIFAELMNLTEDDLGYQKIKSQMEEIFKYSHLMTDEERQQAELLLKKRATMVNNTSEMEAQAEKAKKLYEAYTGDSIDLTSKDANEQYINALSGIYRGDNPQETADAFASLYEQRRKLGYARGGLTNLENNLGKMQNIPGELEKAAAEGKYVAPEEYSQLQNKDVGLLQKIEEQKGRIARKTKEIKELEEQQGLALADQIEVIEEFSASLNQNGVDKFAATGLFSEEELQNLKEAKNIFDKISKNKIIQDKDIKTATKATQDYAEAVKRVQSAIKENSTFAKTYADERKKMVKADEAAEASLNKFLKSLNLNKAIDGIVDLAGGAANVASAFNNIKNLGNIWSDESLTGGEKLLQTLSNISFTIPMIVSGISNLKNGWIQMTSLVNGLKTSYLAWNAAAAAKIALDKADTEQMKTRAFWIQILKENNKNLTFEERAQARAILFKNKTLNEEQIIQLKSIIGDGLKATSLKKVGGAAKQAGTEILKMTGKFLASPVGIVLLAVAAAVAAVTVAVKLGSEAYNKYTLQMEKASEAAEHQKQVYEDVKKAYDDLKNSINDYEDSQKAIDELTEGTEEWRDAIIEANQQITDLIQKYPQLAKYVNKDNSGRLSIQEAGLDIAEQAAFSATNQAYAQSLAATANLNRATELANAEKISQNSDYQTVGSSILGGIKSAIPFWGITERIVKKDFNSIYENETSTEDIVKIAERLNTTEGSSKTIAQLAREVLGENASAAQIEAIENNSDEIKNLAEKLEANSASSELLGEQIMSAYLSTDKNYKDSQYQGVIDEVMGDTYNALLDKYRDEYADKVGGKTDAEIQNEYADMMVATGQWQQKLNVKNKSGNKAEYTYIDANGQPQSLVIDDTVAREALAVQATMKAAGSDANIKAITDAIKTLSKTLPDEIEKAVITAEFTGGRKGNLGALLGSEINELQSLVSTRALGADDEKAKALGYDTAEKYYAAIEAAINDYQTRSKELAAKFADIIATDAWDALTLAQQETISEWYNSFSDGEKTAAIELLKASGKNANQVLSLVEGTKWGEQGASSNLAYQLKNLVPDLDIGLIDQFVNGLEKINGVFGKFNLNATRESYKSIDNIMSSLTETGNIISEADFKILGEQYEEYFITMADGSKKLVKDANEFYNTVYKNRASAAVDSLSDSVQALNDYYEKSRLLEMTPQTALLNSTTKSIALSNDTLNTAKIETANAVGLTTGFTDTIKISDKGREALKTVAEQAERKNLLQEGEFAQIWSDLTDANDSVWYSKTAKRLVDLINNNPDFAFAEWTEETWGENPEWAKLNEELSRLGSEDSLKQAIKDNIDNLGVLGANIVSFEKDNSELFGSLSEEDQDKIRKAAETFKNVYDQTYDWIMTDSMRKLEEQILPSLDKELETLSREFEDLQQAMEITGEVTDELWTALRANIEASQNAAYNKYTGLQTQNSTFLNEDVREYFSKLGLVNVVEESKLKDWLASEESLVNSEYEIRAVLTGLKIADTTGALSEIVDEFLSKYEIFLENFNTNISVALQDYKNELIRELELNLQKFETELNDQLDITEAQKKYNEFLREIKENDFDQDASSYLSDFSLTDSNISTLISALADLESKTKLSAEEIEARAEQGLEIAENEISMADYREQKEEIINKLREEGLSAQEALAQATQTVLDYQDAITEAYDKQADYLDNVINSYEHLVTLNELMYGDQAINHTLRYYDNILNANKSILKTRETQMDAAADDYQKALDSGNETLIESTQAAYLTAAQSYQDALIAYAQSAQDRFYKNIEKRHQEAIQTLEKYKDQYDWTSGENDLFLDTFDAMTGVSKVQADFNKAINATTNINAQQRLKSLMEDEMKLLREKDKLTQYDLDRANKRLEIEQARIALEEAQQNKSQMRLVRGADGNYSYEYVADQNDIEEKRAELESLQNDLVNLDQEKLEESLDTAYELYAEFLTKLEELYKSGASQEDIDILIENYSGRLGNILEYVFDEENGLFKAIENSVSGMNNLFNTSFDIAEAFPWFNEEFITEFRSLWTDGIGEAMSNVANDMKQSSEEFYGIMNGTGEDEPGLLALLENASGKLVNSIQGANGEAGMIGAIESEIGALNTMEEAIWGKDGEGGIVGSIKTFKQLLDDEIIPSLKDITKPDSPTTEPDLDQTTSAETDTNEPSPVLDNKLNDSLLNRYPNLSSSWITSHAQIKPSFSGDYYPNSQNSIASTLNAGNIANMLKANDIVRNLQTSLDVSMMRRMSEMMSSYEASMAAWDIAKDWVTEQTVNINAEFPNATNKNEIQEAFSELLNMATQRVMENKRG